MMTSFQAYNRVMSSNHRAVTKPKDVKFKRISKAKSRSLEELRGKLRDPIQQNKFGLKYPSNLNVKSLTICPKL